MLRTSLSLRAFAGIVRPEVATGALRSFGTKGASDADSGVRPATLYEKLKARGSDFYCGVPDSLLKDFCAYVTDNVPASNHVITANEGNSVALATGFHLATGRIPVVYMQNSGLGNCVNPLTSLTDAEVYSIPMLLVIGWRGQPGVKDEPQHVKKGRVTLDLLNILDIPYSVLPTDENAIDAQLEKAYSFMNQKKSPYALVVETDTFLKYKMRPVLVASEHQYPMCREQAIQVIVDTIPSESPVISTTGKGSRELFEIRANQKAGHHRDFLTVGCMGHTSSIAMGIAQQVPPTRSVYCVDGDGSALMHLGSLAINGCHGPKNFRHIVINNAAHESVGGQPTVGFQVDYCAVAKASQYKNIMFAENADQLRECLVKLETLEGPSFLEVRVRKDGVRANLGRPTTTPVQNKNAFMNFLQKN